MALTADTLSSDLKFDWSSDGIQYSLKKYDRFLEKEIIRDIETNPFDNSVLMDAGRKLYISNVSDNRYAVVWTFEPEELKVAVKYVFPMSFRTEDPEKLLRAATHIIPIDSNWQFALDRLVPHVPKEHLKFDWSADSVWGNFVVDRFLHGLVVKDLQDDPYRHSIQLDEGAKLYMSNVANERYAVVWQMGDGNTVNVKYVFPLQFRTYDPVFMKEALAEFIPRHSQGRYTLEGLVPELAKKPESVSPALQKPPRQVFRL